MKYYEQLLQKEIFTLEDVRQLTGSSPSAKILLRNYVQKGFVKKIKHNLYYCVNLENKNGTANRFIIGSNINDTAYISHHSALEYHGYAHQAFYTLYVASAKVFNSFDFEGITYEYVRCRHTYGVITPETNNKIKVTDLERTVVDCIKSIELAGGLEELFNCLEAIPMLKSDQLIEYLRMYEIQFLYQKAGYILKKYQKELSIKDEVINLCSDKVGNSIRYIDISAQNGNGKLVKEWALVIPENIDKILDQGADELV